MAGERRPEGAVLPGAEIAEMPSVRHRTVYRKGYEAGCFSIVTIKAPKHTREILRELARHEGAPMQVILERAVEDYRRNRMLQETNAAYARLRQDPEAWHAIEMERLELAGTLAEGLD